MNKIIKPSRIAAVVIFTLLLLGIYGVNLYDLQIIQGQAYYNRSQNSIVSTETVKATRGNILDRYGRTLVSSRSCNNLIIQTDELFNEEKVDNPNEVILQLVRLVQETGNTYNDDLPISAESPFVFNPKMTDEDRSRLDQFLEDKKWDSNISAVELMAKFRSRYNIDNSYSSEEMRIIAGIRYSLNMHYVVKTSDYVFVEDASMDLITAIKERGIPGVKVQTSFLREYHTQYAAHLLGYIGKMSPEEYYGTDDTKGYKSKGYKLDSLVGHDGVEYAFEDWLHGSDGEVRITSNASGTTTDMVYLEDPVPGSNVYLTIDIGLQEAAEQSLSTHIKALNEARDAENLKAVQSGNPNGVMELASGGAVVVVDVNTSEPLCIASYPTFDLETMMDNFAELTADETAPMFNRATNGVYAPGSTFKPVTGIAALNEGKVTVDYTIYDEVVFTKYADVDTSYMPTCWVYGKGGGHGNVNITTAIEHSCNYYFYTVGDLLGIDRIAKYANMFGLGKKTGIEIPETAGHMATPEYKAEIYAGSGEAEWFVGDTLASAIGQSVSQFTPLQLANYTAAVANNGHLHQPTLLKTVRSYDGTEKEFDRSTVETSRIDVDQSYYDAVHEGMRLVVTSGNSLSVYETFHGVPYTLAAKTGTAQRGANLANNACFICYAPYENPQIAVAVVVEKGGAGANLATIAKDVLDYYFTFEESASVPESELSLLK